MLTICCLLLNFTHLQPRSELFPTLIRSAVLGYQNQAARVGGIIAPFIVMAGAASGGGGNSNLVPFATFGAAALLAGLLIFSLPETLGVPLPDTLQVGLLCCDVCCVWLAGLLIFSLPETLGVPLPDTLQVGAIMCGFMCATFGAVALLAGLLFFSLPETLGVPLPDTLQVGLLCGLCTRSDLAFQMAHCWGLLLCCGAAC